MTRSSVGILVALAAFLIVALIVVTRPWDENDGFAVVSEPSAEEAGASSHGTPLAPRRERPEEPSSVDDDRASAAGESAATAASRPIRGSITGQVGDRHGDPLGAACVLIKSAKGFVRRVETDPTGGFTAKLPLGRYALTVDPASLAAELLPPWERDMTVNGVAQEAGFIDTVVTLTVEEPAATVALRLFRAARVAGRVIRADGTGVVGAQVRLQSLRPISMDAITVAEGEFLLKDVYPGEYRVELYLAAAEDPALRTLSVPIARDVVIDEGVHSRLADIVVGGACETLSGRVCDLDRAPIAGVKVVAYAVSAPGAARAHNWGSALAHAVTDESGIYLLAGLPAEKVRVRSIDYDHSKPVRETKTCWWGSQVEVDVRRGVANRAPDIEIPRTRLVTLRGKIEIGAGTVAASRAIRSGRDVDVTVEALESTDGNYGRPISLPVRIKVTDTLTFEWEFSLPHPAVVVVVRRSGTDDVVRREIIGAVEGVREEVFEMAP
jgi:hypothetical protein